jgi:hypothetical protein
MMKNGKQQASAKAKVAKYMREALGDDERLCNALIPTFPVGCRRLTPGIGYLNSLRAPNVRVVTDKIAKVVPQGIELSSGEIIELDVIICATGFDVSFCPRFPIIGKGGMNLQDLWTKELPRAYMSCAIPGYPNYFSKFFITSLFLELRCYAIYRQHPPTPNHLLIMSFLLAFLGPNAPIGHGSVFTITEYLGKYIIRILQKCQSEGIKCIEPSLAAVADFEEHIETFMPRTTWAGTCRSWFKNGRETGPVTALHPGSRIHFFHMLERFRGEDWVYGYESPKANRFRYLGNGYSTKELSGEDSTWYLNSPDEML